MSDETLDCWIGIDLGTQSVRVVALGDDGRRLGSASAPLSSARSGTRHEQDPGEWLRLTLTSLRRVTAGLEPGVRVRAVAVSGTSGTIVPFDRAGRPVGPAAMYDDRRGASRVADVQSEGAEVWDRLGYRMQATWGLPKLLEMHRTAPPGTVFGHQPDVITAALAGRLLPSDLSSALKTGADLDAVAWPSEVLDRLDVPLTALNGVVASGTVIATVCAEAAETTGLPESCAIVAGMTDGCAAQLAAGAIETGLWNSVLGTTLVLKGAAAARHRDPTGAVYAHRAPFGTGWYPGGASSTGAGAVSALLPGRDLVALTAAASALRGIPLAYPLVTRGERFPFVADDAVGFWPSSPSDMEDPELLRAIVFGTAFLERLAFDLLREVGYGSARSVLLTGGGAQNAWWNSLRAQVLGAPVKVAAETEGAAGMAVLAAAALAPEDSDRLATAARRLLTPAVDVEPATESPSEVEGAYEGFIAALQARGYLDTDHGVAA